MNLRQRRRAEARAAGKKPKTRKKRNLEVITKPEPKPSRKVIRNPEVGELSMARLKVVRSLFIMRRKSLATILKREPSNDEVCLSMAMNVASNDDMRYVRYIAKNEVF